MSGQFKRFVTLIVTREAAEQFDEQRVVALKLSSVRKVVAEYVAVQGIDTPVVIVHATVDVPG